MLLFSYLLNTLNIAKEHKTVTSGTCTVEKIIILNVKVYAKNKATPNASEINICFFPGSLFFINMQIDNIVTKAARRSHIVEVALSPILKSAKVTTIKNTINMANAPHIFNIPASCFTSLTKPFSLSNVNTHLLSSGVALPLLTNMP